MLPFPKKGNKTILAHLLLVLLFWHEGMTMAVSADAPWRNIPCIQVVKLPLPFPYQTILVVI